MSEVSIIQTQPIELPEPFKEPDLTVEEVEAVAAETGLSAIRIKKLKASSAIGRFIEQCGATKIGRTSVVLATEHVESGLAQCDDLLSKANPEDVGLETLVEIIKLKQGFTELLIKSGLAMMKEEAAAVAVAAPQSLRVPFPAGSMLAIASQPDTQDT